MLNKLIKSIKEMEEFVEEYNLESIGRMRVKALEPSGKKLDFKVLVGQSVPSYTDNKKIVVGYSEMFTNLTGKRIAAIGYALEIHELSHVYFSEFNFFKKFIKDVESDLQNEFKDTEKELYAKGVGTSIARFIYNGIEDGRIEFLVNYKINNAKTLIDGLRSIWWEKQPLNDGDELNHFLFAIVSYATMRILPKGFYDIYPKGHRVYEELSKIENLIKKASRVVSSEEHRDLCYEIYNTSKDYFVKMIEEGQMISEEMETDYENTSESDDISEEVSNNIEEDNDKQGESEGEDLDDNESDSESNGDSDEDSDENDEEKSNESQLDDEKNNEKTNEELKKETEEKIKKAMEEFEKEENKLSTSIENSYKKQKKLDEKEYDVDEHLDEKRTEMVIEDYRLNGGNTKEITYFKPSKKDFNKTIPNSKILNEGKKLERLIADIIERRKSFRKVGLDRGRLNTRALWSIPSGNRKVFRRDRKNKPDDTVGYILIDGSGSMYGKKHEMATESAAIIEQGMKNLIPLKIAQFTVGHSIYHKTVKRFDQNLKNVSYVQSLKNGYMSPTYGNADGISIRIAVEELLERNEGEKILTIISDGLPTDYKNETQALNHVKSTVEYAKSKGITIASIFIGSDSDKRQVEDKFKYMYGEACLFTDGSDLNRKLINIFKKKMM